MKRNREKILKKSIYNKNNFNEFCKLEPENNVKSILKGELPEEFSDEPCGFIDIFRRKTANEKTEWNFYIDYENDEIIHCLHGHSTTVSDWINI